MIENIQVNENIKKYQTIEMMVSLEKGISVEECVRQERKRLFLEYTEDVKLLDTDVNFDKTIKRLEREKFNLIKTKDAIKSEIVVKKALKINLKKTNSKEAKKILLSFEKELFILNINCNLYNDAIRLKRKAIAMFNEKKSHMHRGMKRMRTWERHYLESTAFIENDD